MSSSADPAARGSSERLFHVPLAHRKAALAWLDRGVGIHGSAPRHAAAVVVVRDGERGVEALMLHRPERPSLGQLSFPGGLLEPSDDEPLVWSGPRPTEWAKRLHGSADHGRHANVHVRVAGSPGQRFALAFRDWLRAHPEARDRYASFKAGVAAEHAGDADFDDYTRAKTAFFDEVQEQFEAWGRSH